MLPTIEAVSAAKVILEITNRLFGITRTLLLYHVLQLICFPFIVCYFLARLMTDGSYWYHFGERLGVLPRSFTRTGVGSIWLHAVSVGEIASAAPLIMELASARPRIPIYVSTSTVAGRKAAERQLTAFVSGIFYSPIDSVGCVRRVLKEIRPALLIVLETEIWPNLYHEVKRSGAGLVIVNGRISDRTWPQYRRAAALFCPVLNLADCIMPQSVADRTRYEQLGVRPSKLQLAGNLKYDAAMMSARWELPTFGSQQIWVAASTVGPNERGSIRRHQVDEDDLVIDAFQQLKGEFPGLLLVIAPRQPARFDVVAEKLNRAALPFLRRTSLEKGQSPELQLPGVLLLDTIGELSQLYGIADLVFVGGSIAPRGGHNILEPAAAGKPIIVGPHMENFQAIAKDFLDAAAIVQIKSPEELLPTVRRFLKDPIETETVGRRAAVLMTARRGSSQSIAQQLWPIYYKAQLHPLRPLLSRAVLGGLARLWTLGGEWKRARGTKIAKSVPPLPVPVVSIGGITVGGSGKTPFTKYLADRLRAGGCHPAILTRGYRRRSPAENLVFDAGAIVPAAFTGDEAQIFLRAANAPIGIGADRYETARILLSKFDQTDILLLDDGFQHARLARDLDIVLIDGLDPFGGEATLPAGRLREPLSALERADIFVVTRADNPLRFEAIRERLRHYNSEAPVFRTRLVLRRWRDYRSGATTTVPVRQRVGAFCGLGNPQNFWNTLELLDLNVVFRWAFGDHHSYTPVEIARIAHQARAHGAELLVTTEKDRINLPANLEAALKNMGLAWLEIELELENEADFFSSLEHCVPHPRSPQTRAGVSSSQSFG